MESVFSRCGKFRYLLWERWDATKPMAAWCLMNPSQAGKTVGSKTVEDPTWRKGRGFSQRHGYGGQVFCNLYAFIATNPRHLADARYPIGPENNQHILEAARMSDGRMICAWGGLARGLGRPSEVVEMLRHRAVQLRALGFTKDGLPRHPLMLAYSAPLEDWHPIQ